VSHILRKPVLISIRSHFLPAAIMFGRPRPCFADGGHVIVMNPPVHPTALDLVGNWQVLVAFLLGLVVALLWGCI
jgi:hypothetical protein